MLLQAARRAPDGRLLERPVWCILDGKLKRSTGFGESEAVEAQKALAEYIIEENVPGPSVQSDDELLDYARSNGSTVYHASCSCMMGNHGMSVVDDQLRVHGLEALRIVDASVMPAVSSTNTNAPTLMIAEKGAAMIKDSARKLAA